MSIILSLAVNSRNAEVTITDVAIIVAMRAEFINQMSQEVIPEEKLDARVAYLLMTDPVNSFMGSHMFDKQGTQMIEYLLTCTGDLPTACIFDDVDPTLIMS